MRLISAANIGPKLVRLSDTPLDVYRHAPVAEGIVLFAEVVPVLDEIGNAVPPMPEIIPERPDDDLPASVGALDARGWDRITTADAR